MPSLFRRSIVFADVKNIIVSIDAIVASRLSIFFKENKDYHFFFNKELDNLSSIPVDELKYQIMASKKNKNFLLDYFNWDCIEVDESIDPMAICDFTYANILKIPVTDNDILKNPDIESLMSSVGLSLKTLSADKNLSVVYLFLEDYIPSEVSNGLSFIYRGSNKFKFIKGNKETFLKENMCDTYFLEDISDLDDYILRKHANLSEVLIPNTHYNLSVVDEVEDLKLRTPCTNLTLEKYKEDFNLEVYTMALPI